MSKSFQGHRPKAARLGKAGLGASRPASPPATRAKAAEAPAVKPKRPETMAPVKEIGGPSGPEPTRYGDWERKGICYDF